jgi:hypothetical protein
MHSPDSDDPNVGRGCTRDGNPAARRRGSGAQWGQAQRGCDEQRPGLHWRAVRW